MTFLVIYLFIYDMTAKLFWLCIFRRPNQLSSLAETQGHCGQETSTYVVKA